MARYIPPPTIYDCYLILDGEHIRGECVYDTHHKDRVTVALEATPNLCKKFGRKWLETRMIFVSVPANQVMFVSGETFLA